MKVCHVLSGDLWGGAEVQTTHLLRALKCGRSWQPEALLFRDGTTADHLRSEGIPVHVISEAGKSFLSLTAETGRAFRDIAPDMLHSHGYKEDLVALMARRKARLSVPAVRTQHSTPFPRTTLPMKFYSFLDRRGASRFDRTVAVSGALRSELERFLPPSRITSIMNGIPLPDPALLDKRALPEDPSGFVIGAVGRLAPEKRYDILIEALSLLAADGIKASLVLVGDGPQRAELEEQARSVAPGAVRFAGFQSEVYPWLSSFDLYSISSSREGLPITLLEALACRLPVVATSVGGIPEVIASGENGLLVPPGDPKALAEAIASLHNDREKGRLFGKRGRATVEQKFSIERVASETEKMYADLLEGRGSPFE